MVLLEKLLKIIPPEPGRIIGRLLLGTPLAPRNRETVTSSFGLVELTRDRIGVPTVDAASIEALYFGHGFVVAQDRLWQMEVTRRLAEGRMAEVFGASFLEVDQFHRSLRLRSAACQAFASHSEVGRRTMRAYAEGVNLALERFAETRWPSEFLFLNYSPEPWVAEDCLLVTKINAFLLATNFRAEAFRLTVLQRGGKAALHKVLPRYPSDTPIVGQSANKGALHWHTPKGEEGADELLALRPPDLSQWVGGKAGGSNAWAIAPWRSVDGTAILASDPHIPLGIPNFWHRAELRLQSTKDSFVASGVSVPGIPGLIVGRTADLAWGITNGEIDTQDIVLLSARETEPKIESQQETFIVRDAEHQQKRIEILDGLPVLGRNDHSVAALRWTGFDHGREIDALISLPQAKNWESFRDALRHMGALTLTFIYADVQGNIASKLTGAVPQRAQGSGILPTCVSPETLQFTAIQSFDDLPEVVNPRSGVIVSANNPLAPLSPNDPLSHEWVNPARARRIETVLSNSRAEITSEACRQLQLDLFNEQAALWAPRLITMLGQVPLDDSASAARNCVASWDYRDEAKASAPLIYHLWMEALFSAAFIDVCSDLPTDAVPERELLTEHHCSQLWDAWQNGTVIARGAAAAKVERAFLKAHTRVQLLFGPLPKRWRWGLWHRLEGAHPLGRVSTLMDWLLNGTSFALGGSKTTVCQYGFHANSGLVKSGASWRQVVTLGTDGTTAWETFLRGNAGDPLAAHYDDCTAQHIEGEYRVCMKFSSCKV